MGHGHFNAQDMEKQAAELAGILSALANERRLMIVCKLVEWGEASATSLAEALDLSQSALSQHLAKMRAEGLLGYRRESQTLWYRITDPRIEQLFAVLHRLFCANEKRPTTGRSQRRRRHVAANNFTR